MTDDTAVTRPVAFTIEGVSKSYLGVQALKDVSLTGHAGEVLAICGANGAGKSTMARLLAGVETPSSGRIHVAGFDRPIGSPSDAEDAGILLMHQEPLIIEDFTVAENVLLKDLSHAHDVRPWHLVSRKNRGPVDEALRAVGLGEVSPDDNAGRLSPGLRQMLALSRTQVNPHKILLLDETTASTTEEHFQDVLALVDKERAEGVSVVFVSHRMQEVFSMSDRIAVLRNGELVGVRRTAETDPDEIVTMMIGSAIKRFESMQAAPVADEVPLVKVRGLSSGSAKDVSFDVRPGEILGLYGLVGSGRSSIARSIAGQQDRLAGEVWLKEQPVHPRNPRQALAHGIVYVSEDRRREGFVPDFSNQLNLTLSTLGRFSRLGVLNLGAESKAVRNLIAQYQIKGGGRTMTKSLSGGNQQKVCLAKWLEADPELVILDEPTKGIDIGARMNIYQIVRDLADKGKAVVVVTSEAEEAISLCNRILVVRDGRVAGEVAAATTSTDEIIRVSLGEEAA